MATVAAFNFEEVGATTPDLSGYMTHLTLDAGATRVAGHTAYALSGSGTLPMRMVSLIREGNLGLMGWVRVSGPPAERYLAHMAASTWVETVDHLGILASDPNGFVALRIRGTYHASTVSILDGQWHYLSLSGDKTTFTLKVDDVVAVTAPVEIQNLMDTVALGRTLYDGGHLEGDISDFRMLNDPIDDAALGTSVANFMADPVRDLVEVAYGFNGDGQDSSPYGRHLTVSAPTWGTGNPGSGLDLVADGTVQASTVVALPAGPRFSFICDVKVNVGFSPYQSLFDVYGPDGTRRFEFHLEHTDPGAPDVVVAPRIWIGPSPGTIQWVNAGTFPIGSWHQIAVASFPGGFSIYVDGVQVGGRSDFSPPVLYDWYHTLKIGAGRYTDAAAGDITIDNVRIVSNYLYPDAAYRYAGLDASPAPAPTEPTVTVWDGNTETATEVTVWDGTNEVAASFSKVV